MKPSIPWHSFSTYTVKPNTMILAIVLVLVLVGVVLFFVFAGKKKAEGEELGEEGKEL